MPAVDGAEPSLPPAAALSWRSVRSISPPAPSAGPPTYTTSEPAAGVPPSACGDTSVAPATASTSRTASTAPRSTLGAVTSVTAVGTVTALPATVCSCGCGNTCGSVTLPSGV